VLGGLVLGRTLGTASRLIGTGRLPQGASRRLVPLHTPQVRPLRRTPARPDGACLQKTDRHGWRSVFVLLGPNGR
jgi:hypothetical protein